MTPIRPRPEICAGATLVAAAFALATRIHRDHMQNTIRDSAVWMRGVGQTVRLETLQVSCVLAGLLTWLIFSNCALAVTVGSRWTPIGAPEIQVVCRSEALQARIGNQLTSELRLPRLPAMGKGPYNFVSGVVTESTPSLLEFNALASLEYPGRWQGNNSNIGSGVGVEQIKLRAGDSRFPILSVGARVHFSFEVNFAHLECEAHQENDVLWVHPDEVVVWDDLDAPLLYHYRSVAIPVDRDGYVRGGRRGAAPLNIGPNTREHTPPHPVAKQFRLQPERLGLNARRTKCGRTAWLRVRHEKSSHMSCLGDTVRFSVAEHEMEFVFLGADLWDLDRQGRKSFFAGRTSVALTVAYAYWRSR